MLLCLNEQNLFEVAFLQDCLPFFISEVASMHFGSAVHVAVARLSQTLSSLFFFPHCWLDIVFRFIIEYCSSLRDFWPLGNNRSIFI
jgi:hypothetical protein